ncbi:hypothetical protein LWI29_005224 [Acer saccharum]|uniref:Uncharacterized protein n=1 Tax=Acer saccharum TaxID=4024 RepID=A0AA39V8L0_ACESA|nr:hypothetical protein LWI29_005224 [Acer saccharum]
MCMLTLDGLQFTDCGEDVHLPFRIQTSILQCLHGVPQLFRFILLSLFIFLLILYSPSLKITFGARLHHVVRVHRIGRNGKLDRALGALEVEPKDSYTQICVPDDIFLSGIEFCSFVYVVTAGVATNAHRQHHANVLLTILGSSDPGYCPSSVSICQVVSVLDLVNWWSD